VFGIPSQLPGVGAKISASKQGTSRGGANPRAKLREEDILTIRSLHAQGTSVAQLAREYKVGESTMKDLLRGKTWTHVVDRSIKAELKAIRGVADTSIYSRSFTPRIAFP